MKWNPEFWLPVQMSNRQTWSKTFAKGARARIMARVVVHANTSIGTVNFISFSCVCVTESRHRIIPIIFVCTRLLKRQERYRYRNQSLHYMNIDDDCIISDPWNVCNFVKLPEYYEQNSKLSDFIEIEPDWVDISKFINSRHKLWFSTLISVWFYVAAWSSETFENRVFLSIYP